MPQELSSLTISEVSLVDRPANSSTDKDGRRIPHARVALFKRDDSVEKAGKTEGGVSYPKSDYAFTPDDTPSNWKLRLTASPGGKPDAHIVGAAVAALGKGFRGNKVEIPAEALHGVKAKVRAAWLAANADKGSDELPDILKISKGDHMTLEQIEKKVNDQDAVLKALTDERDVLKAENEAVLKMSKKERKAYASMSEGERKSYMTADAKKQGEMLEKAKACVREKALCDSMDDATKASFEKAGPSSRAAMLEDQEKKLAKSKGPKGDKGEDGEDGEPDGDEVDDEEDYGKAKKAMLKKFDVVDDLVTRVTKAETELAAANKAARVLKFAKRAEIDLPHTAGTPEAKGEMIMKLADSLGDGSTAFDDIMKSLVEADKAIAVHFTEVGKSGGNIPALLVFEKRVSDVSKSNNISVAKATEKVMKDEPQLYLAYEHEQRQQALRQ